MGIGANRSHGLHCNIDREETVEFVYEVPAIDLTPGIEMGYHLLGMHTRIGAPGANDGSLGTK